MKNLIKSIFFLSLIGAAQAGLKEDFEAALKGGKGPFGPNYLQGTKTRELVTANIYPEGYMFQAAFRHHAARALVNKHGIYLGNLFTTNYYELTGEYVHKNAFGSHVLAPKELQLQGEAAIAKAVLMTQNWVLEKHYLANLPGSSLAASFQLRGISGAEFEVPFARYFINFYLGAMGEDFQYLPLYLLAANGPLVDSKSLAKARELVAGSYDFFLKKYGVTDPRVVDMYALRNGIHNQLSPAIIPQIDAYLVKHPFYIAEKHTYLQTIKEILIDYFSFSSAKVAQKAKDAGANDVKAAADVLSAQGVSAERLLALSTSAVKLKDAITTASKKLDTTRAIKLALLVDVTGYLNKELISLPGTVSKEAAAAAVDSAYMQGFLIRDNWDYFKTEALNGAAIPGLMGDLIEAGSASLEEAFALTYKKWVEAEPKMQYFMDNTIKSGALSAAAALARKQ